MFGYVGSYSLQPFRRSSYPGQALGSMIGVDHYSHKLDIPHSVISASRVARVPLEGPLG